jgi:hypothetical protein
MTAVAGTLAYAVEVEADRAVVIIEKFVTENTDDRFHDRNRRDLDRFLVRPTDGNENKVEPGKLLPERRCSRLLMRCT